MSGIETVELTGLHIGERARLSLLYTEDGGESIRLIIEDEAEGDAEIFLEPAAFFTAVRHLEKWQGLL